MNFKQNTAVKRITVKYLSKHKLSQQQGAGYAKEMHKPYKDVVNGDISFYIGLIIMPEDTKLIIYPIILPSSKGR